MGTQQIPLLSNFQNDLTYNIRIEPPGSYVILIEYVSPINRTAEPSDDFSTVYSVDYRNLDFSTKGSVTVKFQSGEDGPEIYALVYLSECPYLTPCRQVMVDDVSKIHAVTVHNANNTIVLGVSNNNIINVPLGI